MFQYEPYDNTRSIGQIIELMMAGPHAAAQAARAGGEARAHAMEIAGQNSAQLGMTLGNIASGTAQQIAHQFSPEAKALQEQRQAMADERNYNISERQRLTQQRGAVDSLMRESIITDPVTGIVTYDRPTLMSGMTKLNLAPDEQEKWLKLLDSSDAAVKTAKEAQNGALKQIAGIVDATGNDSSVFENEVKRAIANGIISERMAAPYLDAARRDPSHIAKVTSAILGKKPDLMAVPAGSSVIDKNADPGAPPLYQAPPKEPVPKSLQSKSVQVDGKSVEAVFDPATGRLSVNGQDVTDRAKPIPPASASVSITTGNDAKDIAAAIIAGEQPPDVKGLYRLSGPVRAELARKGYNLTNANLDWQATQKHIATLNGSKVTQLMSSVSTARESLNVIKELAEQWNGGRFPLLNKANLALAKNGAFGKDAASIATRLDGQITDVTSELGQVYMGGNSPTDHALGLAEKNLKADWDKKVLFDMIDLADRNLLIRENSYRHSTPLGLSTPAQAPTDTQVTVKPPAAAPSGQIIVTDPKGGKHPFATQAQADEFKRLAGIK